MIIKNAIAKKKFIKMYMYMAKYTNSNFGHQLLMALTLNNLSGKKCELPCVLPILKSHSKINPKGFILAFMICMNPIRARIMGHHPGNRRIQSDPGQRRIRS